VQLVDDLLDVSRIVTGKLRLELAPLDLEPIVHAAIDVVLPVAEARGVRLQASLDRGLRVLGDPDRLQQVVWNLLSNALKFTPGEGRVDVRLERVGSLARITVSDTGKGMSPAFLPHLFERFRQEDNTHARRHGGLGLGLAIVRHLVELHGGSVAADSPGEAQGSTFVVELPLHVADARRPVPPAATAPDVAEIALPPLGGLRVLIVEDETDTRQLLSVLLTQVGAQVQAVDSAAAAMAAIERRPPDVLVSDLGLPGTDGYELLRRVQDFETRTRARIPAIALTAYALEEDRRQALGRGFEAHVAKPVEPAELVSAIAGAARAPREPAAGSDDPLSPATASRPRARP
jgi:CheY-like chemotaxis protein